MRCRCGRRLWGCSGICIKGNNEVDLFLQRVYVSEIKAQAQYAINAVDALNNALRGLNAPSRDRESGNLCRSEVFRQTHSFLTHSSNISRLFWPIMPKPKKGEARSAIDNRAAFTEERGKTLRTLFSIDQSNPLKSRTLRDHLEHYDERLDHWSNTSKNRNVASDTIGPANAIFGLDPSDTMRWFDPIRKAFRFRGEEFELQSLATAVVQVFVSAKEIEERLWLSQLPTP